MELSIAIHIIGIITWVGGIMVVTTYLKAAGNSPSEVMTLATRKSWFGYAVPGFLLALVSGIYQIAYRGTAYYFSQGWFHAKLTLVILLVISTMILWREVLRLSKEGHVRETPIRAVQGITGFCFVVIVFLVIFGRPA